MMKKLLFSALALFLAVNVSAEEGDYVYTSTAKFKVTGSELVANGNFADVEAPYTGWASQTGTVDSEVWSLEQGMGPEGVNALKCNSTTDGSKDEFLVFMATELSEGIYVYSFQIKAPENAAFTTTNVKDQSYYFDVFANGDMSAVRADAIISSANAVNVGTDWTTVTDTVVVKEGQANIVISFCKLAAGTMVTNFSLLPAEQVYDTRGVSAQLAFAEKLMADPNFNTEDAADAKKELEELMETINGNIAEGAYDAGEEDSEITDHLVEFNNLLNSYLNVTTNDIASLFSNISITGIAKYNRGGISNEQIIGNLKFYGNNWWHGNGSDVLQKYILKGNDNDPGSVALYHTYIPAGKYYISAEVLNGTAGRGSNDWSTVYDLESTVYGYINGDTMKVEDAYTISGSRYTKVYFVGELKEGKTFEAGFWWNSADRSLISGNPTPVFFVKNFEVRSFDSEVKNKVAHISAFNNYMTQWNAAVSARNKLYTAIGEKNYPWGQTELAEARDKWEPVFMSQFNAWWSDGDGNDTGVASTEQLSTWRLYQGADTTGLSADEKKALEYQLVRGYQNAVNAIAQLNAPFTDLVAAIKDAQTTRNKAANATGDRATFKVAIENAIDSINLVRANTTDATRVADSTALANCKATLAKAVETFLASAVIKPIVDINFTNKIEKVGEGDDSYFAVKGDAGEMVISGNPIYNGAPEDYVADTYPYMNGYEGANEDVLRVGKGTGTVVLPVVLGDEDLLTVSFDVFFGYLVNNAQLYVELQNEAGQRIAGFNNAWNKQGTARVVSYNDFGINFDKAVHVGSSSASNAAIVAESNRSSFEFVLDYKAGTMKGSMKNAKNGLIEGGDSLITKNGLADNKVAKFVLGSTYTNNDRRCWFDNLKIIVQPSAGGDFEEDITKNPELAWNEEVNAIQSVSVKADKTAVYSITGQRLQSIPQKGLYIMNGKKYVVK